MRPGAFGAHLSTVIAGLDPAIHRLGLKLFFSMDARVKPGHDELRRAAFGISRIISASP